MIHLAASTWQRGVPAMLAAVLLSGCTMCPDPFDYSGPVPNGSPPQNDFRARSNGILPLSAAPVPWPPLVKADAEHGGRRSAGRQPDAGTEKAAVTPAAFTKPSAADATATSADESPTVVSPPIADEADTPPAAASSEEAWTDLEPTASDAEPVVEAESTPEKIAAPPLAAPVPAPPLAETPGWRPRR